MKEWLSINQLAEQTLIPDTTIRRYIVKFPDYFQHKGGSRSKRYEDTAIKVLIRIKSLYDEGLETEQVDGFLKSEFPLVIDGDKVEDKTLEKAQLPMLATAEDMTEIKEALNEQMKFNKLLLEKLSVQERYIKESLEKRDQLLIESIRAVQEEKKAILETASEKENRLSFFQRLFNIKNES